MYFELSGVGSPAIVFVHGFACDHTDWNAQVKALEKSFCVIACDLRGHGRTPGDPQDCSITSYGADVARLVKSLHQDPAVFVGHSMGCRVVLEVARQWSSLVAGLVLLDGSVTGIGEPDAAEKSMRQQIAAKGYRSFSDDFFRDMFPIFFDASGAIIERAGKMPETIGGELFPQIARWDAQHMNAVLAAVQVPLLVIQSTRMDPTLKRKPLQAGQSSPWLDRIRKYAPNAQIEIVLGAGHFLHMEKADQVNGMLRDFATGCAAR